MIAFSYKNLRTLARTMPICPKPKAVGLENIPNNGPIIYVYNHITRRGEPFYMGLAAPTKPNIRFLAETVLASREYYPKSLCGKESKRCAGYYLELLGNRIETSAELYYKKLNNKTLSYFKISSSNSGAIGRAPADGRGFNG